MSKEKLISQLNQSVADIQVLYVKLHNYHWNIKGPHFFNIHQVTENYYEYFAGQYDELAERILQLGGKPLATVKEYLATAKIAEESKSEFTTVEVLDGLIKDFDYLRNEFKNLSEISDEANDMGTQALADENVAWLEKALWMLKASK